MTKSECQPITGHTPTPWTIEPKASWSIKTNARAIIDKDRFAVAWIPAWDVADEDSVASPEEAEANAALIVEAVNNYERLSERALAYKGQVESGAAEIAALKARVAKLEAALQFIADGYENHDVSHVDYRVKVYQVALDAIQKDNSHG